MALPSRRRASQKGKEVSTWKFLLVFVIVLIAVPATFFFLVGPKAETYAVPGSASSFDPIGSLGEINAKAGAGYKLVTLELMSVNAEGKLDLTASYEPKPSAKYRFERVEGAVPPPGQAPQGAHSDVKTYVESVTVSVQKPGESHVVTQTTSGSSFGFVSEGMDFNRSKRVMMRPTVPIDMERISLVQMWRLAKKAGAKDDAVAQVKFAHGLTEFLIEGTNIQFRWLPDGSLQAPLLTPDERKELSAS